MLYKCVECGHEIARDAWRCPKCGTEDAGGRAVVGAVLAGWSSAELREQAERDKTDPGWREREKQSRLAEEEKKRAEAEKKEAEKKRVRSKGMRKARVSFVVGIALILMGAIPSIWGNYEYLGFALWGFVFCVFAMCGAVWAVIADEYG